MFIAIFSALFSIAWAIERFIGLGGVPGDLRTIGEVLDMIPDFWGGVAVTCTIVLTVLWLRPRFADGSLPAPLRRLAEKAGAVRSSYNDVTIRIDMDLATGLIFAALFIGGGIVAVSLTPEYRWEHPTMTESEQERVKTECKMATYEAFSGKNSNNPTVRGEMSEYEDACLKAKGFERFLVEDG